ncbi:flagellar assembly protein FliW [Helicobacter pullorum]|uniref:Flagellar assembly factor FliW n=2 Tax=Helicobacter pullorum TaxID=35818 RepID=A0A0N1ED36_9HELI|nr:flagellar assembly protein FliW [Helicobacter pullorum]EEQ63587.1 protein FliW [Helicobacter pullorum MIT 98-5489]KAB0575265.1 flagellar assembly protein FliW [Helicobacter pullorum NCTC 12824]KPH50497.1 flagellar assembly protein FliW [Helicobacter pullorum]KPH52133.1 flagellar assembly protein FliW [Helicobacter pullorum]KPH53069.1 flagellar assembly protein FliW [Helicobacter pullorum]
MEFVVKSPILGFEHIQKMKLEKIAKDDDTFMQLKSCENDGISFTLVNPYAMRSDYEFEIPSPIKALLELKGKTNIDPQNSKLVTLNIVCIKDPIEESTVNFLAPVLFNFENLTMAQVVLENFKYENFGLSEPISKFFDFNKTE